MSHLDKKMLRRLRFIRFMTAYVPIWMMQRLTKMSTKMANLPENVSRTPIEFDEISGEWIIPEEAEPDKVLMYLHGGGFVFGQSAPHLEMAATLALRMNIRILMVDYRLAPKYPFPAALGDSLASYTWLLKKGYLAENIVIGGDSAGGNLCLSLLMKLRDQDIPLPAAAVCLSPVINLTQRKQDGKDLVLPRRAQRKYRSSYLAGQDPKNPLISPAFGQWHDLPPILIHVGEKENLREDALLAKDVTRATNTEVIVKIFPNMFHVWQIYPELEETEESLGEITEFLMKHLES